MGVLTIYLDKATNLKDEDTIGTSDPYIKFSLEQDNLIKDKDYGDTKSTVKKNELNPVYGETVSSMYTSSFFGIVHAYWYYS